MPYRKLVQVSTAKELKRAWKTGHNMINDFKIDPRDCGDAKGPCAYRDFLQLKLDKECSHGAILYIGDMIQAIITIMIDGKYKKQKK